MCHFFTHDARVHHAKSASKCHLLRKTMKHNFSIPRHLGLCRVTLAQDKRERTAASWFRRGFWYAYPTLPTSIPTSIHHGMTLGRQSCHERVTQSVDEEESPHQALEECMNLDPPAGEQKKTGTRRRERNEGLERRRDATHRIQTTVRVQRAS